MLSVIIPSYNEENYIAACLDAIVAQMDLPADHAMQVIVAANGCKDQTVPIAEQKRAALESAGFSFHVLDIARGNKMNALNEAEKIAAHENRAYLDADVIIGPRILIELAEILREDTPIYASGTIVIPRPQNIFSRAYAKVWANLPFVKDGVPGIGLYAMNAKGRSRWGAFPDIYSDDRFVRLQFQSSERRKTKATYQWPLPEGFKNLVHVRHRWSEGNMELAEQYPDLMQNDTERNKTGSSVASLFHTPFSSAVFVAIFAVSNLRASRTKNSEGFIWRRGRD
jgi:glycosyltransferase involved in cell wall biosynthesis